jgi:putative transposase
MWSYRKLKLRLATTLENHGIAAFEIPEDDTSKTCARHGCEVVRGPRGLVRCPHGHTMHADVNAAMNILARERRESADASESTKLHTDSEQGHTRERKR